jgi:hypothetical protein
MAHHNVRFGSLADIAARQRDVRFTPIADIRLRDWNVRFVPIADIQQAICANKKYRFVAVSLNR